jgi:hypothetical protein
MYYALQGWKLVKQVDNITLRITPSKSVTAFSDSADLCGMADCEFYDISEDATRRFLQDQRKEQSLEGMFPTIH